MANATYDWINCRWVPNPPIITPIVVSGGGPVPAGFPTNQLFIASDGSQWAYSTGQAKWVNVGTPYSLNPAVTPPAATAGSGSSAGSGGGSSSTTPAPVVSVTTAAPAPAQNVAQSIFDWATQATLIPPLPNWVPGAVLFFVGWKFLQPAGARR